MYILTNPQANGSLERTITNYQYEAMDPEIQRLYTPDYQSDDNDPEQNIAPDLLGASIFSPEDDDSDDTSQDTSDVPNAPEEFEGFGGGDMGGGGSGGSWDDTLSDTDTGSDSSSDSSCSDSGGDD